MAPIGGSTTSDTGAGDTSTTVSTPTPAPQSCSPSCSCVGDKLVRVDGQCNETTEACEHGCHNGECKGKGMEDVQTCSSGWKCLPGKGNWRAFQREDCSWVREEFCEAGCVGGRCRCASVGCSHYYSLGRCGVFDDGCGHQINCTGCGSGRKCVGGKCECVPKTSCVSSECGTESDGCGHSINCGVCDKGFVCVQGQCL